MCVCVCEYVRGRESLCVCVRDRERVCACVWMDGWMHVCVRIMSVCMFVCLNTYVRFS